MALDVTTLRQAFLSWAESSSHNGLQYSLTLNGCSVKSLLGVLFDSSLSFKFTSLAFVKPHFPF